MPEVASLADAEKVMLTMLLFAGMLAVGISWLWNYLTYQRSARLITGDTGAGPMARDAQPLERTCA